MTTARIPGYIVPSATVFTHGRETFEAAELNIDVTC